MPLTKKSGALFSIYADSPVKESSTSATTSTRQAAKQSPSKQRPTAGGRKVLGTVSAPTPASDIKGNPSKEEQPKLKPKTKSTTHNVTSPELKKVAARRKRETSMQATAVPRGETMRPVEDTRTPAKKTRTTPRRSEVHLDEENVPPADSPASRTRSKTRAAAAADASPSVALVPTAGPRRLEAMIGDGRGALSTSSGRAIARYLKSADDGEMQEMDEIMQGEQVIGKAKGARVAALLQRHENGFASGSTPTKGKAKAGRGKGLAVLGDGPLADVSEAYGASGVEPAGFRDCKYFSSCQSSSTRQAYLIM